MSLKHFEIHDYYSEIFFTYDNELYHNYITYDKSKIRGINKGFKFDDTQTFLLKTWANVPVSSNEIIDLNLNLLKNNEIDNFTVQYRTIMDLNILKTGKLMIPLLSGFTQNDIHMMLIRSDFGYKNKTSHFNIDLYNKENIKINSNEHSHYEQNFTITSYEMALHLVFMQVEKHNILIGPKYWLSPFQIHIDRVYNVYESWKKSKILTPLCILSRNIHTQILLETHGKNIGLSENDFQQILYKEIENCKSFEKDNPEDFYVNIPNSKHMFILPFNFFKPDDRAIVYFGVYKNRIFQSLQFEPSGAIFYNRSNGYYNSGI
ncbi:MAG: hypothetical protein ACRD6U_05185 [Nitrososphaeraceae archaeon]